MKKTLLLTSIALASLNASETDNTETLRSRIDKEINKGYEVVLVPNEDFSPSVENCEALILAYTHLSAVTNGKEDISSVNRFVNQFLARLEECVEKRAQERAEEAKPKTMVERLKSLGSQNKPAEKTLFERLKD